MPKRKKHPKLPNGYGSIRYLGKGRRNPYAVQPPVTSWKIDGTPERPGTLCYVNDWYVGFAVLNAWHAGTYKKGDEEKFKADCPVNDRELDGLCRRIMDDFAAAGKTNGKETFSDVYEKFYDWKYGANAKRKLSKQSMRSTSAAFKNCAALHDKPFSGLRHADLQECVDACPLKSSSVDNMVSLIKQMYKYALLYDICDRDYSQGLKSITQNSEHGIPFSDEELGILWGNKENPVVASILIMCYSGFRISAYQTMEVNLEQGYFRGGVKTAAGKDRIVPIHSAIKPLVFAQISRFGGVLDKSPEAFRASMYETLSVLGMEKHTPHDCRHTFSRLCEKYGVKESDRKRMMGHSFGSDITNGIYGHRTLSELREEIEKIKTPEICAQQRKSKSQKFVPSREDQSPETYVQ